MSACRAVGCRVETEHGRPFCAAHWERVPGVLRSSISFSARMRKLRAAEPTIERAIAALREARA